MLPELALPQLENFGIRVGVESFLGTADKGLIILQCEVVKSPAKLLLDDRRGCEAAFTRFCKLAFIIRAPGVEVAFNGQCGGVLRAGRDPRDYFLLEEK